MGIDSNMSREETSWILYDVATNAFILVALWWLLLSLPAIKNLKQHHSIPVSQNPVLDSFSRVWKTVKEIRRHKQPFLFLAAVFSAKRMLLAGIAVYCFSTFLAFLLPSIMDNSLKIKAFWVIAFLVTTSIGFIIFLSKSPAHFNKLKSTQSTKFPTIKKTVNSFSNSILKNMSVKVWPLPITSDCP